MEEEITIEKINEVLEKLFEEYPFPKFHPSVEKEIDNYLKEHLDDFYVMDYSTGTSFINVDKLKTVLKEYDAH